jgi:glycosyltransferase involved in cell wall biosynthesis
LSGARVRAGAHAEPALAEGGAIHPQRLCIVVPSTGEFDSRTYRIASAVAARGHDVTVLGRLSPGVPDEEHHPAGYRIIRVSVSSIGGLPFPRVIRLVQALSRRVYGRGSAKITTTFVSPPSRGSAVETTPGAHATAIQGPVPAASRRPVPRLIVLRRMLVALPRRVGLAVLRWLATPLTMRAQRIASRGAIDGADLYHGMAYNAVPTALELGRRDDAPVIYDARDIYLHAGGLARRRGLIKWAIDHDERRSVRDADQVITVNDSYAAVMADRWRIAPPTVVMNCAYRQRRDGSPPRKFHEALELADAERVILSHGALKDGRGIPELLAAIQNVPGATLVLMGYGPLADQIADTIESDPTLRKRARLLPAVPPDTLLDWVASADLVAMPIQPTTLNHRLTTPNKLFEAIAVGVPVVASDLPGMASIVSSIECGVLVDPTDPQSIASGCRTLLAEEPDVATARRARILAAAHETYNWERQLDTLLAEYGRLSGSPW